MLVQQYIDEDKQWVASPEARHTVSNYFKNPIPKSQLESNDMAEYIAQRDVNRSHLNPPCTAQSIVSQSTAPLRSLSSLLTFPLTMSYALGKVRNALGPLSCFRVLIVGARSESSLPMQWWKEYLYHSVNKSPQTIIKTVGPGLQLNKSISMKRDTVTYEQDDVVYSLQLSNDLHSNSSTNDLHSNDRIVLHDHPNCMELLQWADVFVLFNPGYGSKPLTKQWDPTIRLLLQTKKPVICTAHGPADLDRDLSTLDRISTEEDWQDLGENVDLLFTPHENPFRSIKQTLDMNETEDCKVVTANHSIYGFIAK